MAASSRSRKSSGNGVGCLVWLGLLIVVVFLFIANWGRINQVLEDSHIKEILKDRTRIGASPAPSAAPSPASSAGPLRPKPSPAPSARPEPSPLPSPSQRPQPAPSARPAASPAGASPKPSARPLPTQASRMRAATLCFVRVDDDGTIVIKESRRALPQSDSPLMDSLAALMAGPTQDELSKGYISLIPQGSKVLSVTMRGTTALVNLSEAFMFNSLGVDGYAGQLKQIVWTCTAFPNVHDVQVLIEGRKVDYLGGDSVYIGLPLARNSF